jgi:hypothetical protein
MNVVNHVLKATTYRVTSPFGMRTLTIGGKTTTSFHYGIDLGPRVEVISPSRGKVIGVRTTVKESQTAEIIAKAITSLYRGNYVFIQHGNVVTRYVHLEYGSIPSRIKVGAIVEKGEVIGKVGSTGYSTGPHLHFEVLENGKQVDPAIYLTGQKNFVDYYDVVPITRDGVPTFTVIAQSLNYRKSPNGERIGTLPQNALLPYLGKSPLINGYEWAEIIFENQIVYSAINPQWNTIDLNYKEVVKSEKVEVIPNIDQTFESGKARIRVILGPK